LICGPPHCFQSHSTTPGHPPSAVQPHTTPLVLTPALSIITTMVQEVSATSQTALKSYCITPSALLAAEMDCSSCSRRSSPNRTRVRRILSCGRSSRILPSSTRRPGRAGSPTGTSGRTLETSLRKASTTRHREHRDSSRATCT